MILNDSTFKRVKYLLNAGKYMDSVTYCGATGKLVCFQLLQFGGYLKQFAVAGYMVTVDQDFKIKKVQRLRIFGYDKQAQRYEQKYLPLIKQI